MQLPLQITFRNMQPSAAVEAKVRERAEKPAARPVPGDSARQPTASCQKA